MSGSTGGSDWGALGRLFSSIFGGGSSSLGDLSGAASNVAASTPTDVTQAAWAMNPALSGIPETTQSLAATTGTSGGGWNDKVGKALGDLSKTSKLGSSSADSSAGKSASQVQASSSAHAGQGPNLSSLVSELIKRRTPYFQMTGQPVEQGQTNRGLLGL